MKTIGIFLAILSVISVTQAFSLPTNFSSILTNIVSEFKAFKDLAKMSIADRLKEARSKCPQHNALSDDTINQNIEGHLRRANSSTIAKSFEEGLTCLSVAFSPEEFKSKYLNLQISEDAKSRPAPAEDASRQKRAAPPASFDWRTKGAVSPVQNQGQCGSCWTFSANGAMEGAIFSKTGKLVNLSEQNLIDCVKNTSSNGCQGGWMIDAYDYSKKNGGVDIETSYPYTAKDGTTCKFAASGNGGKVSSYAYTKQNDENDLVNNLLLRPVAAAIDATFIQSYTKGVITCPNYKDVNHGILVVGYGTNAADGDYFIIKNSWGTSWGENGYARIARNKNNTMNCGLAGLANYPLP